MESCCFSQFARQKISPKLLIPTKIACFLLIGMVQNTQNVPWIMTTFRSGVVRNLMSPDSKDGVIVMTHVQKKKQVEITL